MKNIFLSLFSFPLLLAAQPVLLPHIGLTSAPQATDLICVPTPYTGEMDTSGYAEGDLVADFTLYKTNGDSVRLSDALSTGIPVLLVGGNYTCPVFRQKITALNNITNYYAGLLQVFVVYGIEAHPIVDPSPYSGFVWITAENNAEDVLYEQPDTYAERLELIDSLLANYTIVPEILVDGPCNNWWLNFGPAPNNAYLIDTNGIVAAKHGWFHRNPQNMWCDIDSLLGTNSGNCTVVPNNGTFSYTLTGADSNTYGVPGEVLSVHGILQNLSSTDNAEVNISKQIIDIPTGWSTALCGDVCYSSSVSSANIVIPPGDDLHFVFYFYTAAAADSGYVNVRFKNLNVPGNIIHQQYSGITAEPQSISGNDLRAVKIFPNPFHDQFTISTPHKISGEPYTIQDHLGRIILSGEIQPGQTEISVSHLAPGFYYLRINDACFKIIRN